MNSSPASTTTVKLAVAAYNQSTFFNTDVQNANGAVRLIVLEGSFGGIDLSNTNFLDKTNSWINDMRAAGQLVFGYVPCNSGESDPATILAGIVNTNGAITVSGINTWYQRYPQIDGIYLDEGPQFEAFHVSSINRQTIQDNYMAYGQAIQSKTVMDGTMQRNWRVMIEASMYPFDWVLQIGEFLLLWEGSAADYENKYNGFLQGTGQVFSTPDWWCTVPDLGSIKGPERVVHTIWSYTPDSLKNPGDPPNPPDMSEISSLLGKVQGRCAGSVYLTDTFGKLPAYWAQEVAAV